ncbi:pumilio homolog 6, chloroplastic-like [Eurytemora carolleeae]|uniref:pumilio homolog 6, chloroplastic-like n=1 Tax=Eurytemora carolleeae TaxID=1294199 RepID=UPI000C776EF7|nr:pumilio homolog 6, chloroplastic-like [Eurytemora carolleeae]|eukprot:XP_023327257.1 pumilio homolog 6, chloroplastic-like [Eurytemora affinis]
MDSSSLCNAACTRDGSQFIQNNIDLASPSDVSSVLRFTIGHILRLSCNSFGNFVIQKIFEYALPHEKSEMAWTLLKDVKTLCSSKFGTRVMQAILPHLEGYQISLILDQVIQDIVHFSTNEYTNHTMLRLIEKMVSLCPLEEPKFVHSVQKHLRDFIEDPDAMRIILKMVYCCSDELKSGLKDSLLCRIERDPSIVSSATAYILVVELYENGTERDKQRIFEMCRERIGKLASLKWGSHIVHSILQTGSKQEVAVILQNLNNKVRLRSLLSTKYGGVTVQKMLMLLDVPDLVQVFTILQNMKVSNSIPLEAAESLVLSIIKTTKEPSIVDISSGFLIGGREFPLSAEAGLGFFRVKRWMLSIFKGEKVELEVTEIPLFILCLTEIAVYKDNPGLGLLRQHLISFIEGIINQHNLKESRSKK